jgi:hypothetical protein
VDVGFVEFAVCRASPALLDPLRNHLTILFGL